MTKISVYILYILFVFSLNSFKAEASGKGVPVKRKAGGGGSGGNKDALSPGKRKANASIKVKIINNEEDFEGFGKEINKKKKESPELFVGVDDVLSGILESAEESIDDEDFIVLGLYEGSELISFAIAQNESKLKWSLDLIVTFERSKGLGRFTLDALIKIIGKKEADHDFILSLEATRPALPWYKSLGFTCDAAHEAHVEREYVRCTMKMSSQTHFFHKQ